MKVVIQRVKSASVRVEGKETAAIGKGFLLFVGIDKSDDLEKIERMAKKIVKMRIIEDENGKMNLDIIGSKGEILSVPQFTLSARTEKGNRPGFDDAADPDKAQRLWIKFNDFLKKYGINISEGTFGAHMDVSLVNDGPVTFVL
ncbi:MAG: D-aminoacyl-tRNA deacylase [Candidatus Omnitrophota bacterium]